MVDHGSSADNEAYLMTAFHSAGNTTYTLSGPGGTISPWPSPWLGSRTTNFCDTAAKTCHFKQSV